MNRWQSAYYLFTWHGYESGGVIDDFRGCYATLEEAMRPENGLLQIGCVLEVRSDGLWIAAEYDGWPPKWKMVGERLE